MINLKNKIVRGSMILLLLVGLFNMLNFLYHIIMARILPIEQFGLLKRVFAFLYIGAIFMESIQTVVVKYASIPEQNDGKLKNIFIRATKGIIKPAMTIAILFLITSLIISPILNIPLSILFATTIFIVGSMFAPINRGILQGQQRFWALGFSMLGEAIFKICASLLLVYLGFGVLGAVWGVVISIFLSLALSLVYLRKIFKSEVLFAKLEGIRAYSKPVFLVTLVLILFINVDVLLSGYFFDQTSAGIYALASTIGLIIFIGVQPVNKVLFPIAVNDSAINKKSKTNFIRAIVLISIICLIALSIIFLFTDKILYLLSNKSLPQAVMPTILLSIGTVFLSLSSSLLYYKLSQGKTSNYLWMLSFLVIEIILLCLFSESLVSYSYAFLFSNVILFFGSFAVLRK